MGWHYDWEKIYNNYKNQSQPTAETTQSAQAWQPEEGKSYTWKDNQWIPMDESGGLLSKEEQIRSERIAQGLEVNPATLALMEREYALRMQENQANNGATQQFQDWQGQQMRQQLMERQGYIEDVVPYLTQNYQSQLQTEKQKMAEELQRQRELERQQLLTQLTAPSDWIKRWTVQNWRY
jgi:hypothetical protein